MIFLKSIDFLFVSFVIILSIIVYLKYLKYSVKTLVFLYILYILFCTTSYFPKQLIYSIECKQNKIDLTKLNKENIFYIVILGSTNNQSSRISPFEQLHITSKGRLLEAIKIKKQLKKSIIITLGAPFNSEESNASMMKRAAIEKGILKNEILAIGTPTSTLEEAESVKKILPNEKIIILVTDALHMPRAANIFNDFGYTVIKAPTNYLVKTNKASFDFPNKYSYELTKIYLNTIIKQLYYDLSKGGILSFT